jgi:NAD(P)-dependent dehydrogenase (short-subunit alcohol dehydrogenase family)
MPAIKCRTIMNIPNPLRSYQAPPNLLANRTILVTGAGDGIGRAVALACARHGATIILLGRTQRKLEAVYDQIEKEQKNPPLLMPVDLAKAGLLEFEQIATAIERQFGHLDGLAHCAALLGNLTPLSMYSLETWSQVMQVNLNAPYLLTRALYGVLAKSDSASVIFSSSEVARQGRAYWGAYAAAGAALENLCRTWTDESGANTNIRFNTLDPGAVRTALRARAYPGEDPSRLPSPEEVSAAYLYLAGPDSQHCKGQMLSA